MLKMPPPQDDGLFIREVGDWARDKHHFLLRYIDAFVTSMRRKQWSGLHYVDLFADAGLTRLKKSRRLEWGSPLIAAHAPHKFDCLHVCEINAQKIDALRERLRA